MGGTESWKSREYNLKMEDVFCFKWCIEVVGKAVWFGDKGHYQWSCELGVGSGSCILFEESDSEVREQYFGGESKFQASFLYMCVSTSKIDACLNMLYRKKTYIYMPQKEKIKDNSKRS